MNTTITPVKAIVGDKALIHKVSLTINNVSGSLERVIRIVRHRSFEMLFLNVEVSADSRVAFIKLSVRSDRHLSTLTKQLEKLFDVQALRVESQNIKGLDHARTA